MKHISNKQRAETLATRLSALRMLGRGRKAMIEAIHEALVESREAGWESALDAAAMDAERAAFYDRADGGEGER